MQSSGLNEVSKTVQWGARWEKLWSRRARVQRPLWALTGTKNPKYSDRVHIETLIGPDTVNTMPPATYDAFRDHGTAVVTITDDLKGAHQASTNCERSESIHGDN